MTGLSILLVFVTSLVLTISIIPIVLKFSRLMNLYDYPDLATTSDGSMLLPRRIHTQPMPRLGGIGMVLGFIASTSLWLSGSPLKIVYLASFLMFCLGLYDDLKPLPAKFRLCVQILVASLVVHQLDLSIRHFVLSSEYIINLPDSLGYALSVFVIVGAINAINLTDGLDGLAGGVVMIGVVLLSIIYFLSSKDLNLICYLSLPLLGSLIGFLRYNTHPASIFMGDCGSNWLGLLVGVFLVFVFSGTSLATVNDQQVVQTLTYKLPLLSIILCIALPVLDTAFVMIRRILAGKNPMAADKTHFHHTLLFIGLSHSQSVAAIYFLSFILGVLGIMPIAYHNHHLEFILLLAIGIWIAVLTLSLQINENAAENINIFKSRLLLKSGFRPYYTKMVMFLEVFNRYLIYGILSIVPLVAGIPLEALGYASLVGLALLAFASLSSDQHSFFQSFVISVASTILLTAINFNSLSISLLGRVYNIQYIYNAIFILLMISTLLYIAMTFRRRYFIVTPTDFLVIALPLCLLFVPEPHQTNFKLNIISLRSLVFFISVRALTRRYHGAFRRVMFMCAIGLIYVFFVSVCGLRIIY